MWRILLIAMVLMTGFASVTGQTFPGISAAQKKQLKGCGYLVPLPTWLPAGFAADTVIAITGKDVPVEEKSLQISYSRKLNDSLFQNFVIAAGFDGLGSLWYKGEKLQSGAGIIKMYYQPFEDIGDGKKEQVTDLVSTEWFTVGKTDFNVRVNTPFDQYADETAGETGFRYEIISKADFKRILQSIKVYR